ncbi:MAG: hypothetical protein PVI30_10905 [Myxococcales bacterium]
MPTARVIRKALEAFLVGEGQLELLRMRDPRERATPQSRRHGRWLDGPHGREALAEAREEGELGGAQLDQLEVQARQARHVLRREAARERRDRALVEASLPGGQPLSLEQSVPRLCAADDATRRDALARELVHALRPVAEAWTVGMARAEAPLLELAEPAAPPPSFEPQRSAGGLLLVSSIEEALVAGPHGAAGEQAPPRRELPAGAWAAQAGALLRATDDALEDALRFCARNLSRSYPLPWPVLLRAVRAPELDSGSGAKQRWYRAAGWLRVLGFERDLGSRVRAEVDARAVLPFANEALPGPPVDVRVGQSALDYGVASDVHAAFGVARALGASLCLPTLPVELRWPLPGSMADAFGGLASQLWGEPVHLERIHGLSEAEARRVGRLSATLALLDVRLSCAVAVAELPDADAGPGRRMEALATVVGRALGADVPPPVAALLAADRVALRRRARGHLTALALHCALRERYDEDWYRNARAAEPLRAACARGNGLTGERFLEELGGDPADAVARAVELVA